MGKRETRRGCRNEEQRAPTLVPQRSPREAAGPCHTPINFSANLPGAPDKVCYKAPLCTHPSSLLSATQDDNVGSTVGPLGKKKKKKKEKSRECRPPAALAAGFAASRLEPCNAKLRKRHKMTSSFIRKAPVNWRRFRTQRSQDV